MADSTLDQIQHLVDALSPLEQVRLLEYLTPRIAHIVVSMHKPTPTGTTMTGEAWSKFLRVGDAIAASDTPESETLTATVLQMRQ